MNQAADQNCESQADETYHPIPIQLQQAGGTPQFGYDQHDRDYARPSDPDAIQPIFKFPKAYDLQNRHHRQRNRRYG